MQALTLALALIYTVVCLLLICAASIFSFLGTMIVKEDLVSSSASVSMASASSRAALAAAVEKKRSQAQVSKS